MVVVTRVAGYGGWGAGVSALFVKLWVLFLFLFFAIVNSSQIGI